MADEKVASMTQHHEPDEPKIQADDVQDGDLALKILHTHFEPYTKQEEKRLLRKIDFRLALLMLFVNGLQFVDKLVNTFSVFVQTLLLT